MSAGDGRPATPIRPRWTTRTLVAAKAQIPVAHVEAGLRSFDRSMPEEVNRLVTDRLSQLLFATSVDAVAHLGNEGVPASQIHFVGNPMIDTLLANLDRFDVDRLRTQLDLTGPYVAATLHRPSNVDHVVDVAELVKALHAVADQVQVVLPLHPRGRARMDGAGLASHRNVRVVDPLGYIEFLSLVRGADAVVTVDALLDQLGRRVVLGGDHDAGRAVPHAAPQHRTAGHDQSWHQPPGDPSRSAQGGARRPGCGRALAWADAAALGRQSRGPRGRCHTQVSRCQLTHC